MIKNVIKRLFPKLDTVKEEKILKIFGPAVLQPNLWHINKKSVSRGFAIGAFCAFVPIPGIQMLLAAFLAITFAGNLPIAVILTWITNPFTYVPIVYFAIQIGGLFVNTKTIHEIKSEDINFVGNFSQSNYELSATSNFYINQLKNSTVKYVENKNAAANIVLNINTDSSLYQIKKADISVEELLFDVEGTYTNNKNSSFINLNIKGRNIDLQTAFSIFPKEYFN